jgi:Gluconate 2-dehydrogenase subunit 3
MMDDCAPAERQEKFMQGMKEFEAYTLKKTGRTFTQCNDEERKSIVAELDKEKQADKGMVFFYQATKHLTTQAYTTCEYYLTKIRGYKMIPGKFQGCVPLKRA